MYIQPTFAQVFNIAPLVLVVVGLVLNFREMIGLVDMFGILAGVVFIVAAALIGYLLGDSDGNFKSVMGLDTG